jgi:hypothetical protein
MEDSITDYAIIGLLQIIVATNTLLPSIVPSLQSSPTIVHSELQAVRPKFLLLLRVFNNMRSYFKEK